MNEGTRVLVVAALGVLPVGTLWVNAVRMTVIPLTLDITGVASAADNDLRPSLHWCVAQSSSGSERPLRYVSFRARLGREAPGLMTAIPSPRKCASNGRGSHHATILGGRHMGTRFLMLALFGAVVLSPQTVVGQESVSYKVLATSKTSTMQKELQEAGDNGYRFVAAMGGETAMGGKEVVVLVEKVANDKTRYEFRLLATSKTSTLQKELQQAADAGWLAVGQTVFESAFGGQETAAILERNSSQPSTLRFEYKLIATSKTSTLAKELQEGVEQGFRAVGMTVGKTLMGGSELVVVTRRPAK